MKSLPALVRHWPDALQEDWSERAAIVAEGCHRSREESEAMAEKMIRAREEKRAKAPQQ